jgi:NAD(P)-dependent dehydrogenase (short-subunit alcohol dehydrogenase family)
MSPPVVVITGGSSGIGRATAHEFAKRRARLVLAARGSEGLAAAVEECRRDGAEVGPIGVDMADAGSVNELRRKAVEIFGRIDVWVNCAAVLMLGSFEETPPAAFRRVIETNLFGYAYGSRAALSQFRLQGDRGVLVNVSSLLGMTGEPYASAYVASKFAIRGLTACIREEMRDSPNIHVCTVMPAAIDTPIYQHAANHTGKGARSIFPVYDPYRVARAIVGVAEKPRREVVVGGFGHLLNFGIRVAPGMVERLIERIGLQLQFNNRVVNPSDGNLYSAQSCQLGTTGGWRQYWRARLTGFWH